MANEPTNEKTPTIDSDGDDTLDFVAVEVKGLILDPSSNDPIVILRDTDGARFLPIWIGVFEANAIALALEGVEAPRPMSHDLMANLLTSLEARVARVAVVRLVDGTFFAEVLLIAADGTAIPVDARPSDAIALSLRLAAPLFVESNVFDQAQRADHANKLADEEKLRKWLEEVDPEELGKYKM